MQLVHRWRHVHQQFPVSRGRQDATTLYMAHMVRRAVFRVNGHPVREPVAVATLLLDQFRRDVRLTPGLPVVAAYGRLIALAGDGLRATESAVLRHRAGIFALVSLGKVVTGRVVARHAGEEFPPEVSVALEDLVQPLSRPAVRCLVLVHSTVVHRVSVLVQVISWSI